VAIARSYLELVVSKVKAPTARAPASVTKRYRYKCSRCKDLLRVKIKGEVGVSVWCPLCRPNRKNAAEKAELILDSLIRSSSSNTREP
jgi:hypothetical protein